MPSLLPPGVVVVERGWLSSNSIVVLGRDEAGLVDSGYWTHAEQTVDLVARAVGDRALTKLLNTHLHSDHCGGNAALQDQYSGLQTLIPPGLASAVRQWDPVALTYVPTGQHCPRFRFDGLLCPGDSVVLGDLTWQVHGAPGHDPHSIVLFEPRSRTLASADALWQNGFGVVFQELEGEAAFDEVASTLQVIERLRPKVVIPGHGPVFDDVAAALSRARSRLAAYRSDPRRHAAHGSKVLLKFKLLEVQRARRGDFMAWAEDVGYLRLVHQRFFAATPLRAWIATLLDGLVASGAARIVDGSFLNA
jgi:glyoxylase-like metal-dependent hydrolase (beta-lactamase superfamily II)